MNTRPGRRQGTGGLGRLLFGLLVAWVAVVPCARAGVGAPQLDGTFVQLDRQHVVWSRQRWSRELSGMANLRLGTLVVQWCREPGLSHLAPRELPEPTSTVATLISLADTVGLDLFLGLHHDPAYWERVAAPAAEVRGYLHGLLEANLAVARELVPRVAGSSSFRGFYIPQEIDDLHWQDPDKRGQLAWFLGTLRAELKKMAPGAKVVVSTFARGRMSPGGFAAAWVELLAAAPLEAVLFQDGFGNGGLSAAALARYLEELDVIRGPVQLWAVVEAFRVLDQEQGVFRADSAPLARVREQLQVAAGRTDRRVAFSLRYLSTTGDVPGAAELAGGYRRYLEEAR